MAFRATSRYTELVLAFTLNLVMPEKEPYNRDDISKIPLLDLSKMVIKGAIRTLHNPSETKELIKTEIRRFRRLMRHKFYY